MKKMTVILGLIVVCSTVFADVDSTNTSDGDCMDKIARKFYADGSANILKYYEAQHTIEYSTSEREIEDAKKQMLSLLPKLNPAVIEQERQEMLRRMLSCR